MRSWSGRPPRVDVRAVVDGRELDADVAAGGARAARGLYAGIGGRVAAHTSYWFDDAHGLSSSLTTLKGWLGCGTLVPRTRLRPGLAIARGAFWSTTPPVTFT